MSTDATRIKGLCNACCQAMGSFIKGTGRMICIMIYVNIVLAMFFVALILFGGSAMVCDALVFAADRKKLMQEYLEKGIRVNGTVRRQWTEVESTSSETESAVEKAIVCYEAPADGNHYQMNLIPLDQKTKREITETRMVQVLILEDYPASGCPQSWINPDAFSLSLFGRFLLFLAGCGFAAFWAAIPVLIITEDNSTPNLVLICVLVAFGVFLIFTIIFLLAFRSSKRNVLLNFSKKMEGQSIDMTSTHLHNPLDVMDQMIRRVFFPCINCRSRSNEESIQE
eukprot:scaffold33859_cov60-Attheya_sp.AAC.1